MKKSTKSLGVIAIVLLLIVLLVFISLPNTIEDVKNEENVGKTVKVRGEVTGVLKLGPLSGYTLEDETGSIAISSDDLPVEQEIVTVKGTLIKDSLFGYYIRVN